MRMRRGRVYSMLSERQTEAARDRLAARAGRGRPLVWREGGGPGALGQRFERRSGRFERCSRALERRLRARPGGRVGPSAHGGGVERAPKSVQAALKAVATRGAVATRWAGASYSPIQGGHFGAWGAHPWRRGGRWKLEADSASRSADRHSRICVGSVSSDVLHRVPVSYITTYYCMHILASSSMHK